MLIVVSTVDVIAFFVKSEALWVYEAALIQDVEAISIVLTFQFFYLFLCESKWSGIIGWEQFLVLINFLQADKVPHYVITAKECLLK